MLHEVRNNIVERAIYEFRIKRILAPYKHINRLYQVWYGKERVNSSAMELDKMHHLAMMGYMDG